MKQETALLILFWSLLTRAKRKSHVLLCHECVHVSLFPCHVMQQATAKLQNDSKQRFSTHGIERA